MIQFALSIATFALAMPAYTLTQHALARWSPERLDEYRWLQPGISFAVMGLFVLNGIVMLPVSNEAKSLFVGLVGLIVTTMIALSSTTFISNAMAGLMLHAVRSYRTGDFIQVGDYFGRVTERRAFHTEIQTEDRDLTTLPNMYLISQPIKVVRSSGTIVCCTISLGYDVSHAKLEPLLLHAVAAADLEDAFVQVLELGDFSITYRVAGLLKDVRGLLPARSHLRKSVLDTLHNNDIEIVSPSFMYQRRQEPDTKVIPDGRQRRRKKKRRQSEDEINNKVVFGKAELAEKIDYLCPQKELIRQRLAAKQYASDEWNLANDHDRRQQVILDQMRIEAIEIASFCQRDFDNAAIVGDRLEEIENELLRQDSHPFDQLDKVLLETIDLIVRGEQKPGREKMNQAPPSKRKAIRWDELGPRSK